MPWYFKHHHHGFSYADTIAPLFIFIVGLGFRMSFLNRVGESGTKAARHTAMRRYAVLMGIGLLYGGFHLRAAVWDALMDIGCAGMLSIYLIHWRLSHRVVAAVFFLSLYQCIFIHTGYGQWVILNSINGGPLGPLSWVFIFLMGTCAYDLMLPARSRRFLYICVLIGLLLMVSGHLLRLEWPGFKAAWPYTQYGMSAPYPVSASGLCFLTLALFFVFCDMARLRLPHLTVLGRNPLLLYLAQAALTGIVGAVLPSSLSAQYAVAGFLAVYACCYGIAWMLHRRGLIFKI